MSNSARKKKTILFLAANPKNSTPLRLEEEVKEIDEGLQRAKKREKFRLEQKWAVTHRDFRRAVLELDPQIVHFSGHGAGEEGLVLEDEAGQAQFLGADGLEKLFKLFADQIECVILNACYSDVQAEAIAHYIPYVIGMRQAVGDRAAQEFAVGFYDALGAGKPIEFAYEYACTSISMAGIPEDLNPVLKTRFEVLSRSNEGQVEPIQDPSVVMQQPVQERQLEAVGTTRSTHISPLDKLVVLDDPEGCVSLSSLLYIERPPVETDCYAAILKPGALIRVKAPRQMGKTSLMQRILQHAAQHGHRTVDIHFQLIDSEFLSSIDQFLQWFCASITDKLGLEDRLANSWKGILGSKNKCTNYFQRYLLSEIEAPLTLGLDEVDQVFQHPQIANDFFGLLRAWHERGKNEEIWKKLRLVIVHSKEVYIPLNINQSPFNVGLSLELPGLNRSQITDLVHRHGLNWGPEQVERLTKLLDGHPYLLRRALYDIARGTLTLEELLQVAPTEEGPYSDHLRRHLLNIMDDPALVAAMKEVVMTEAPVRIEPVEAFKLRSMGLVELRGNDVVPLCSLYRIYFKDLLGGST